MFVCEERTKMKIQAQPGLPLIPSMFSMAAASKPEKAPERDAAEKNIAILVEGDLFRLMFYAGCRM